ncbi:MAG: ornithine cyclodeaminase family protein [Ilumatobacteraceae bacterium]
MLIVDEDTIRSAVTLRDARVTVAHAFELLSRGEVIAPTELSMTLPNGGEVHVKGAHLAGSPWVSFKVATGAFGGPNHGYTSVIDAATGAPCALLRDGGWLTEIRTAAASAVASQALANPGSTSVAILGAGIQAGYQIAAMREAFPIEQVTVWSRTAASRDRFASAHDATAEPTVQDAVRNADIVICCTPSTEPILDIGWLAPGTHVTAVGADTASKRELDGGVLERCDVLVCDDIEVSLAVGELHHQAAARARAVTLGDVLTGESDGRIDAQQITVADLCGLGIQDAAMADLVMATIETGQ